MSSLTGLSSQNRTRSSYSALAALALLAGACSSGGGGEGTLTVAWTLNGTADATLCDTNVGWVVVRVTDYAGNLWKNSNTPCHTFNVSFGNVPSGTFGVSAYVFNAGTNATLGTVDTHSVTINASTTTTDNIDFAIPTSN